MKTKIFLFYFTVIQVRALEEHNHNHYQLNVHRVQSFDDNQQPKKY